MISKTGKECKRMHFCFVKREDTPEILAFIKGLAEYENMLDQMAAVPVSDRTVYRITGDTLQNLGSPIEKTFQRLEYI